jgi:two-component system response regulator YesN
MMEKLLIVDDEYLVRTGLSETVNWQSLGLEVVGTAQNGEKGLQLAHELQPDLIISDVRMPVMDGLEMAKRLFDEKADLAIIVYSGYKDFEYAHRALDSGVAGFLLKPIENEVLEKRVHEVMNNLHEKRKSERIFNQYKKNIPLMKKKQTEILLNDKDAEETVREQLSLLGENIPHSGTLIYCRSELGNLGKLNQEIENKLTGFLNYYEEFDGYSIFITSADSETAKQELNKIIVSNVKNPDMRFSIALVRLEDCIADAFKRAEAVSNSMIFSAVSTIATEDNGGLKIKKLVRDALKIIEKNYNKKLSVRSVAESLNTSESHLMHEFKEETGRTFNDCLTDFRILKAKEFLLNGDMRVGEVAYSVGYTDFKYFGQVFKERLGCTPSEFVAKAQI